MRVVGVDTYGGPEVLRVFEVPEPHAGPGEVRIRVHAAAVSPTDTFLRAGLRAEQYKELTPPFVSGMDAAGILDEIGEGAVTDLAVGDRVMAIVLPFGSHGAYSEFLVVPAESVAAAPAGSTHAEASTLPMNGLTARLSLDLLKLAPGQTIAVTGAAGAYGGYVVQLAKAAGLTVLADASDKDRALVQGLGADVVLPRGDDLASNIRARLPDGVDAVADGALLFAKVMPAIKDGGGLAVVRGFTGTAERGIAVHPVWVRDYVKAQAKLAELGRLVESGQVTLRVARIVTATEAAEAHRILEAGGTRGRVVIEF